MARVTRAASKAMTRERVLAEAERLFREQGYAATSLEQIAAAAEVTKGAIYGHFSSKEDLLLSAIEAAPTPDYAQVLNDRSRPLRQRLADFGRSMALAEETTDKAELAASLEFIAALLRRPEALARYAEGHERRLAELAAEDEEQPLPGVTPFQTWAIGHALSVGLQIYRCLTPEIFTPELFARTYELLADLYPDVPGECPV